MEGAGAKSETLYRIVVIMDTGIQNQKWAERIIDACIAQGLDYFCCAPGSRSAPLMLAIAQQPQACKIVHFDERGVGFHALGFGKASSKPAVVVATSGTAVGNLLPAVMEAYCDRIPLLLLTADRPPELRDCGANQTCDQVKLFANHVRWQLDLPCPDESIPEKYLTSTIAHAVAMATSQSAGPVHINCMFREPFPDKPVLTNLRSNAHTQVHFSHPILRPAEDSIAYWSQKLIGQTQGIIIAASNTGKDSDAILALAQRLQWPIFADILSDVRRVKSPYVIEHFDLILQAKQLRSLECVIQFGDRFVSKTLSDWVRKRLLAFYLHLSSHIERQDPNHLATHRVQTCPSLFTKALLEHLPPQAMHPWMEHWGQWNERCRSALGDFFAHSPTLTEPGLAWEIASCADRDWAVFLGNSMPIRDGNQFFPSQLCFGPLFANRGVSGIDGNIATAAGIAQGGNRPVLALWETLPCSTTSTRWLCSSS